MPVWQLSSIIKLMEELNKTQLILLALLVSFVTSIATGIVTVALMEQAPQGVTQTINRIVERTIETIQPGEEKVVTYETVVVESDLIKTAVQKNLDGLIVFYTGKDDSRKEAGSGFLITADGMAIVGARVLSQMIVGDMSAEYNGEVFGVRVFSYEKDSDFAIVHLEIDEENTSVDESSFKPLSLAKEKDISLGSSVVAVDTTNDIEIASGMITRLEMGEIETEAQTTTSDRVRYIHTNINIPLSASGGPLILLDGSVAGMIISTSEGLYAVPAFILKETLDITIQQGVETAIGNEQAASLLQINESVEQQEEDQTEQENVEENVADENLTE